MKELSPRDALKMKIDALSPNVKYYFALGQALKNEVLPEEDAKFMKHKRFELLSKFKNGEKEEVINFIAFREQNDKHIRRKENK